MVAGREARRNLTVSLTMGDSSTGWGSISVTVSLGVAELRTGERRDDVVRRADEALYVAKAAGRNRVHRSN